MAPNFYLHVGAIRKGTDQPSAKLHYGPFASVEEAQTKQRELTHERGYEYTVRINHEPISN